MFMEKTLREELQDALNFAFSVNYMVLDNFRHVDPTNHEGAFSRNDIFGPKSRKDQVYEGLYKDYATIRNQCFENLQRFFDSYDYQNRFETTATDLVNIYNIATNKKISANDYFTKTDVKDVSIFEKMVEDIETNNSLPAKNKADCYIALNNFALFYEQYKLWLNSYEIFNTLKDDITQHGSKSYLFGKPTNKNILSMDRDTFYQFIDPILDFVIEYEKTLEKQQKHLIKEIQHGHNELEDELEESLTKSIAIKLIYIADAAFEQRFDSATKKPEPNSKLNKLLDNVLSKYIFKETPFTIEKIYVHKNELLDLAQAMSIFPELQSQSELLSSIAVSGDRDLSKLNQQKENA